MDRSIEMEGTWRRQVWIGTWRRQLWSAARALAAHALLLTFTILLVLKLHHPIFSGSWWFVFSPLWLFHVVVARGRFSIPSPPDLDGCLWAPFHAAVAAPLLIAFELLLCVYLESIYVNQVAALSLKIVFLPVFIFETIIIIDNLRFLFWQITLEIIENNSIEAEITPDQWKLAGGDFQCDDPYNILIIPNMAFVVVVTVYMFHKLNGDEYSPGLILVLGWIQFPLGYATCLLDLMYYPSPWKMRECRATRIPRRWRSLRTLGGSFIMILIFGFLVLLYVYLQATPDPAGHPEIPLAYIFSPLFLLQGIGVVFYASQLVEGIVMIMMLHSHVGNRPYFTFTARARDFVEFLCHGSRHLGWWSIDEGSTEAQARRLHFESGCKTFCGSHPNVVKKMPKKDLVEEVCTLQATIKKHIQLNKSSQQVYQLLRNERILCKICFLREIDVLLLPCRHRLLCSTCGEMCSECPICRVTIAKRYRLYCE